MSTAISFFTGDGNGESVGRGKCEVVVEGEGCTKAVEAGTNVGGGCGDCYLGGLRHCDLVKSVLFERKLQGASPFGKGPNGRCGLTETNTADTP